MNGLLGTDVLVDYLLRAGVMLLTIPFHEAAHALVSWLLGDPTAKNAGRLSLNPIRHFDPLGALCMVVGGVGWAKPVGINVRNFKNPKVGMAVSAAAGPLSNLLLAFVATIFYKYLYYSAAFGGRAAPELLMDFLWYLISMNISL
ncbi:MAG: site-2 protease family protein, partial [Gemmiger sp.]|nr:site-2 protease family protein [Gemmiger sp.]